MKADEANKNFSKAESRKTTKMISASVQH